LLFFRQNSEWVGIRSAQRHTYQKILPQGSGPALGKSVQIRTPPGERANGRTPLDRIEKRRAELHIAIMEKVPLAAEEPELPVGGVASHLKHPFRM